MQVPARLIRVDETMISWLRRLPVWGRIRYGVLGSTYIPWWVEEILRQELLDEDCRRLLGTLLVDMNGVPLEELGVKLREWDEVVKAGCASGRLVEWGLAHIGTSTKELKPTKLAFDPRIQFLTGMSNTIS